MEEDIQEKKNSSLPDKFISETRTVEKQVREKVFTYIAGGLGLVAGLAWNDAIKSAIEFFFPLKENTLMAKLLYAVILTVIVTLALVYLERLFRKREKQ